MAKIDIIDNIKFLRLTRLLGISKAQVLGHLELFWIRAYRTDTNNGLASIDIEAWAEWDGEDGKFSDSLEKSGFVDVCDGLYSIHDYFDHAPRYIKQRQWRKSSSSETTTELNDTQCGSVDTVSGQNVSLERNKNKKENKKEKEKRKEYNGANAPCPSVDAFVSAWNENAQTLHLPLIVSMTESRRSSLRCRQKEAAWRESWEQALSRIKGCDFLLGENERGWKADAEWFLRPDTVTKILEGKYDNQKQHVSPGAIDPELLRACGVTV